MRIRQTTRDLYAPKWARRHDPTPNTPRWSQDSGSRGTCGDRCLFDMPLEATKLTTENTRIRPDETHPHRRSKQNVWFPDKKPKLNSMSIGTLTDRMMSVRHDVVVYSYTMLCLQAIEREEFFICYTMSLLWLLSIKGTCVRFYWIPSHCGINGNEKVD